MTLPLTVPGAGWARLGEAEELPPWYKPYVFVKTGYRLNYTPRECLCSIFEAHNETLNIWTHLVGLVVWWWCTHRLWDVVPETMRGIHAVLWSACALMPLASATAHAMHASGPAMSKVVWRCDMASVAVLLYSRSLLEGGVLLCDSRLLAVWVAAATAVFFAAGSMAVVFDQPDWLAPTFVFLHIPLVKFLLTDYDDGAAVGVSLACLGSLSGLVGFALRALHIPERWRRHRTAIFFDLVGASHQLWHVATILGPVLCLYGDVALLDVVRTTRNCPALAALSSFG